MTSGLIIALRNLLRHPARSALTLLGVAVGVMVYVMLASLAEGMLGQIDAILRRTGVDVVVQARRAATPLASRIPAGVAAEVASLDGVGAALTVVLGPVRMEEAPYVLVIGVSDPAFVAEGLGLAPATVAALAPGSALLGERLARKLGRSPGDELPVGGSRPLRVAAVFRTGNGVADQAVILPLATARDLLRRADDDANLVLLRAADGYHPYGIVQRIREKGGGVEAASSSDFMGSHALADSARVFTGVVSALALVLSCAFVANVLVMSVPERKGELGILMAMGWSRRRIVGTLFAEATALCLAGGALGNGLGWVGLVLLQGSRITGLDWVRAAVSPRIALGSVALCLAMGTLGALYPAVLVWRLSPAEALESQ